MANAKKCDVCGKLYEISDSKQQYHLPIDNPVSVMTVNFKTGSRSMDLCPMCIYSYLTRMRQSLNEEI